MSKASIVAGTGPYRFGESVSTGALVASWAPGGRTPDGGYWAKAECFQNGSIAYAQWVDLTPPIMQDGFTFGPTPSWAGGAAIGRLTLHAFRNGAQSRPLDTDTFTVEA